MDTSWTCPGRGLDISPSEQAHLDALPHLLPVARVAREAPFDERLLWRSGEPAGSLSSRPSSLLLRAPPAHL